VSVCIPTYNGAEWIEECLDSALRQTYRPLEILIIDDVSTDNTLEIVRAIADERIRVVVNAKNHGLVGNWNQCLRLAQGDYIKFLFQDDTLQPHCVERMMRLFARHESLGLVFSPREIILDERVEAGVARAWLEIYGTLHTRFANVGEFNDGRALFAQHMRQFAEHLHKGFIWSCIGEPTTVLIKKECFARVGSFNPQMRQACDIEMWLRIMFFYDIGFFDEKLSAFRVHLASASFANSARKDWDDPFWLLESLLIHEEIRAAHPEIAAMRDNLLARSSLLRPSAGWRSLRDAEGIRQALADASRLPQRTRFLMNYYAHRFRRLVGRSRLREPL
jgi:glycosyltransferase involved in cell wall biosynthesis